MNLHVCTEEKLLHCHRLQLYNRERIDILPSTGLGSITGYTIEIENNVKADGTIASYPSTGSFHTYVSDHPQASGISIRYWYY